MIISLSHLHAAQARAGGGGRAGPATTQVVSLNLNFCRVYTDSQLKVLTLVKATV